MRRVVDIVPSGRWSAGDARATATLAFTERYRRRLALTADDGTAFLLDQAEAVVLADGDGLRLDDGSWIVVRAADEDVCDVDCPTPAALARIAWHLGNRHLPVQVLPHGLRIRADPVIADMLRGLGARISRRRAPFTPESGAYAKDHAHGHP
jgi:urease accessory protein